jgi:hypothetical protein
MPKVDPEEVYRVLSLFDDFPVTGNQVARRASASGASAETIDFFEALEKIEDDEEVVALAEEHNLSQDPPSLEINFSSQDKEDETEIMG